MKAIKANYWQRGQGPSVICLHCSASSSRQWESLADLISDRYSVIGADLYGYGKTPMWRRSGDFTLWHEVELLDDIFANLKEPAFLIGHSYGGAVALTAALKYPRLVNGIIAYEPVLFNLLNERAGFEKEASEIKEVHSSLKRFLADGDLESASRRFVDYWSGAGSFNSLPDSFQKGVASTIAKADLDFEATINANTTLADFGTITAPVALLYGMDSPSPTKSIVHLLAGAIPGAEIRGLLGWGHMWMLSHKEMANAVIARFLDQEDSSRSRGLRVETKSPRNMTMLEKSGR